MDKSWYCLDCCLNELKIGTCCCSFRRLDLACPIHPIDCGSRVHCHSYYNKLQENELTSAFLDVNKLRVPLNDDKSQKYYLRSFTELEKPQCKLKTAINLRLENFETSIAEDNSYEPVGFAPPKKRY